MNTRERREARADRLRKWAAKREADVAAVRAADEVYTNDFALTTQPGHIPIRARVIARADRAYQSHLKAEAMSSKADNIEAAADRAIYSDDPDVLERLEERIATLEAERDVIKAFQKSCRTGPPDVGMLTEEQRTELRATRGMGAYNGFPPYKINNLTANIARLKKRREAVRA